MNHSQSSHHIFPSLSSSSSSLNHSLSSSVLAQQSVLHHQKQLLLDSNFKQQFFSELNNDFNKLNNSPQQYVAVYNQRNAEEVAVASNDSVPPSLLSSVKHYKSKAKILENSSNPQLYHQAYNAVSKRTPGQSVSQRTQRLDKIKGLASMLDNTHNILQEQQNTISNRLRSKQFINADDISNSASIQHDLIHSSLHLQRKPTHNALISHNTKKTQNYITNQSVIYEEMLQNAGLTEEIPAKHGKNSNSHNSSNKLRFDDVELTELNRIHNENMLQLRRKQEHKLRSAHSQQNSLSLALSSALDTLNGSEFLSFLTPQLSVLNNSAAKLLQSVHFLSPEHAILLAKYLSHYQLISEQLCKFLALHSAEQAQKNQEKQLQSTTLERNVNVDEEKVLVEGLKALILVFDSIPRPENDEELSEDEENDNFLLEEHEISLQKIMKQFEFSSSRPILSPEEKFSQQTALNRAKLALDPDYLARFKQFHKNLRLFSSGLSAEDTQKLEIVLGENKNYTGILQFQEKIQQNLKNNELAALIHANSHTSKQKNAFFVQNTASRVEKTNILLALETLFTYFAREQAILSQKNLLLSAEMAQLQGIMVQQAENHRISIRTYEKALQQLNNQGRDEEKEVKQLSAVLEQERRAREKDESHIEQLESQLEQLTFTMKQLTLTYREGSLYRKTQKTQATQTATANTTAGTEGPSTGASNTPAMRVRRKSVSKSGHQRKASQGSQ
jgi:hypothetical protein